MNQKNFMNLRQWSYQEPNDFPCHSSSGSLHALCERVRRSAECYCQQLACHLVCGHLAANYSDCTLNYSDTLVLGHYTRYVSVSGDRQSVTVSSWRHLFCTLNYSVTLVLGHYTRYVSVSGDRQSVTVSSWRVTWYVDTWRLTIVSALLTTIAECYCQVGAPPGMDTWRLIIVMHSNYSVTLVLGHYTRYVSVSGDRQSVTVSSWRVTCVCTLNYSVTLVLGHYTRYVSVSGDRQSVTVSSWCATWCVDTWRLIIFWVTTRAIECVGRSAECYCQQLARHLVCGHLAANYSECTLNYSVTLVLGHYTRYVSVSGDRQSVTVSSWRATWCVDTWRLIICHSSSGSLHALCECVGRSAECYCQQLARHLVCGHLAANYSECTLNYSVTLVLGHYTRYVSVSGDRQSVPVSSWRATSYVDTWRLTIVTAILTTVSLSLIGCGRHQGVILHRLFASFPGIQTLPACQSQIHFAKQTSTRLLLSQPGLCIWQEIDNDEHTLGRHQGVILHRLFASVPGIQTLPACQSQIHFAEQTSTRLLLSQPGLCIWQEIDNDEHTLGRHQGVILHRLFASVPGIQTLPACQSQIHFAEQTSTRLLLSQPAWAIDNNEHTLGRHQGVILHRLFASVPGIQTLPACQSQIHFAEQTSTRLLLSQPGLRVWTDLIVPYLVQSGTKQSRSFVLERGFDNIPPSLECRNWREMWMVS
ncbi:hypothetical protein J6590_064543 [Homalodisca vitripennis]|nr:hypothetical protein J6590_064543 [Homalodisca vitripennis]